MIKRMLAKLAPSTGGRFGLLWVIPVAAAAGLAFSAFSGGPRVTAEAAGAFSPDQKASIEKIIREYLLANPDLFLEVQAELEKRMEKLQAERSKSAITDNAQSLFRRKESPVAGNPDGDITVVEFFDYNCGFCKRGFADVAKLIEKDPNVKVVLKEFPIFGKASEDAARVALAAKKQGKYWEVHGGLLQSEGRLDEASSLKIAEKLGLDMEKLKADMQAEDVTNEIMLVRDLATKMGINGTPHFLVGDRTIAGAPEDLVEQISHYAEEMRKSGGCKVC